MPSLNAREKVGIDVNHGIVLHVSATGRARSSIKARDRLFTSVW